MTENTITLDAVRFTWQVNNATLETRRMTTPPVDGVPSTVTASAGTESVNRVADRHAVACDIDVDVHVE